MNDKEDNKTGGFQLSRDGVNCLCCKFKKILIIRKLKQLLKIIKLLVMLLKIGAVLR